ncbi:MAG: omptin family outer membrane protease [Treponema sp.]|nr:omptin family outer membrane protease [Treponema sp.]
MIAGKKAAASLAAALLLAVSFQAHAQRISVLGKYGLYMEGSLGIGWPKEEEAVYERPGADGLASQILWDAGAVFSGGLALGFGPRDRHIDWGPVLGAGVRWAFAKNGISMEDSDWDAAGNLYVYSESGGSRMGGMEASGSAGFSWPLFGRAYVALSASVWYSRSDWMSADGYIRLARQGGGPEYPIYGAGIRYLQEWVAFGPALSLGWKALGLVRVSGDFALYPYLKGNHVDHHYFRDEPSEDGWRYTSFMDSVSGRLALDLCGNAGVSFGSGEAYFYFGWRKSFGARGDTVLKSAGTVLIEFEEKDSAGASYGEIYMGLKLRLWI